MKLLKHKNHNNDSLFDAVQEIIPIRKDDIIIVGTDGLYDNLYDNEIIALIEKYHKKYSPDEFTRILPEVIANEAFIKSQDYSNKSPFAKKASKYGKFYEGGKPDDITVLVFLASSIK